MVGLFYLRVWSNGNSSSINDNGNDNNINNNNNKVNI